MLQANNVSAFLDKHLIVHAGADPGGGLGGVATPCSFAGAREGAQKASVITR